MKYAIIIPDGCADEPQESLAGKTPLQAAQIPAMDAVAASGIERMNIGAQCVGIASRCYDMMVTYAKERVLFGEPIAAKQAVQAMIVDSYVDVHTTRLVTYDAAWKYDQGHDTRVEAGMVKLIGSEMVARVVDRAIQVHGGYGVTTELPFAHWYNRIRPMRVYEGPTEVQKFQILARALLHR